MNRFVCIHGHFYQPPRENPWLEAVESQESATPFHDWNERITAECYEPNRAARILDAQGAIAGILNNYGQISFNFGPTLLSWLERYSPPTHAAIVAADRESRKEFDGHGVALAQAWGHIILPLANDRDKLTQVVWGIRDFEYRFGRKPEGMWLPEAAVDLASLDLLAAHGIRFTILSPFQARRVRLLIRDEWTDVGAGTIDTRRPYLCRLPSGRSIALFFYDGQVAREVAFGGLLNSGDDLARKLKDAFVSGAEAQLVHIATDGESYGHHHRFGEMALAYALRKLQTDQQVTLTVYGAFLERFPPRHEVEILEMSSWSCAHGVERWRSDCGCRIASPPGWTQAWRAPLRAAFDRLRDRLAPLYEEYAGRFFADPWAARNAYIDIILDRSPEQVKRFIRQQARHELTEAEVRVALALLEMQRHALQMYTSCGWFFDEVSGIETVQLLAYAARAVQLAEAACGVRLEEEFRRDLALVPSNKPRWGHAGRLYDELVRPEQVDLARVAAHHAIAAVFDEAERDAIYCYELEELCRQRVTVGKTELAVGRVRIRSAITWEEETFCYAALHYGNHHVTAGVRPFRGEPICDEASATLCAAFEAGDIALVSHLMDRHFGGGTSTLSQLFKDERQRIVKRIIGRKVDEILDNFRTIHEDHLALLRFLNDIGMAIPAPLAAVTEQIINDELLRILDAPISDPHRVRELFAEADRFDLKLDQAQLAYAAALKSRKLLSVLTESPDDLDRLRQAVDGLRLLRELPFAVDLWQAQNLYLELRSRPGAQAGEGATTHRDLFRQLGTLLGIRVAT